MKGTLEEIGSFIRENRGDILDLGLVFADVFLVVGKLVIQFAADVTSALSAVLPDPEADRNRESRC